MSCSADPGNHNKAEGEWLLPHPSTWSDAWRSSSLKPGIIKGLVSCLLLSFVRLPGIGVLVTRYGKQAAVGSAGNVPHYQLKPV